MAKLLTETQDKAELILKKVLLMARDETNEENRQVSAMIFSRLAETLGTELCDSFVAFDFLMFFDDIQIKVVREAIVQLPPLAKVVSYNFFKERILPSYNKKCQDHIWGIRKVCVEILVDISKICELKDRCDTLTKLLLVFLEDPNKWVKISAYKALGQFIATLEGGELNEKLFSHYMKMTDHSINYISNDNEIMGACAYYYPAVL